MILSGDPIPAKAAREGGLVDEIIEGDLVAGAEFVQQDEDKLKVAGLPPVV